MSKRINPPAFPACSENPEDELRSFYEPGMTLRDYFAAKAMHAMLSYQDDTPDRDTAGYSYDIAEAMLAERGRR